MAVLGVRSRGTLRTVKVPWLMVLGVCVLFVVVDVAGRHGLKHAPGLVGRQRHHGPATCCGSAASARRPRTRVNNLPAYLALEPVASSDPRRLMALLIGVNCGPLVTIWASLATLLWRDRCRKGWVDGPRRHVRLAGRPLRGGLGRRRGPR